LVYADLWSSDESAEGDTSPEEIIGVRLSLTTYPISVKGY